MSRALPSQTLSSTLSLLRARAPHPPDVAIVLGSGLGPVADMLETRTTIEYAELPNMPTSSVVGHAGRFSAGVWAGKRVIAMQGRVHLYEIKKTIKIDRKKKGLRV